MGSSVFPPAASGPTLSEITSAGNSAGWGNGDSPWVLLSSASNSSSLSSITFSGLGSYKRYKILVPRTDLSANANLYVKMNNTTSGYTRGGYYLYNSQINSGSSYSSSYMYIGSGGPTIAHSQIIFENPGSGIVEVNSEFAGNYTYEPVNKYTHMHPSISSISSITIGADGATMSGTYIYLYGAN